MVFLHQVRQAPPPTPLHQILPQALGRPDAELRPLDGIDPVTYRYDGIQIEIFDFTADLPAALGLNCCIFCNSCLPRQLTRIEDILQVS